MSAKIVKYSNSFRFAAAAGGIAITNGLGRVVLGGLSERIGRENAMIWSYILTGVFLFVTLIAGAVPSEILFVIAALLALFFWGPSFSLFPATIGHYYREWPPAPIKGRAGKAGGRSSSRAPPRGRCG